MSGTLLRTWPVLLVLGLVLPLLGMTPAVAEPSTGAPGDPGAGDGPVYAEEEPDEEPDTAAARIDGADRIATAAHIAELTFEPRPETMTAVVARADHFPDALAAAALAGLHDGPVLLTWPDRLPSRTADVLDALGVDEVLLLGGADAISPAVEEELARDRGVDRISGEDRFATAARVAEQVVAARDGLPESEGRATVLLASGERFADALTAGPLAFAQVHPILLTARDTLPEPTSEVLAELPVERVIALGGTAAIADEVLDAIAERGIETERVFGSDRTATAAAFAEVLVDRFDFDVRRPLLARGDAFPDALAAGPRGGSVRAPILLTVDPDSVGGPTHGWLGDQCPAVEYVQAVGGVGAVSEAALSAAVSAAESCGEPEPQRTLTYQTGTRGAVAADFATFRLRVEEALNDERGWSLGGDIAFVEVEADAQVRIWLASPQEVAGAAGVCSAQWSCRVGDDLYINDERWRESTQTYRHAGRSLTEYRWYVVNHEMGHWLGHPDYDHTCDTPEEPAPVMNQQSIRLNGCATNVWPLQWEKDLVRDNWL